MKLYFQIFFSFLFASGLWIGCSANTSGASGDSGTDAGRDGDVDPDNPDEGDMPQDLPALCQADIVQASASEQSDVVDGNDKGSSRFSDIGFGGDAVMTWDYFENYNLPDPSAVWEIQVTPYVPAALQDGGVDGGTGGTQPGPIQNPFTAGPVSKKPAIAGRSNGYGVVWLDGRWDSGCTAEDIVNCNMEVAFARVDAAGNPLDGSTPTRITSTPLSKVIDRPDIAATDSGWILVWLEMDSTGTRVVSVALNQEGAAVGSPRVLSTEPDVENTAMPAVAAVGNVAVVVWGVMNQQKILARVLNQLGEPQNSTPTLLDEGTLCVTPRIAGGNSGFLVSWSKMRGVDQEVFTRRLDAAGSPLDEPRRITWTPENVSRSVPAWDGSSFALAWLSAHANGAKTCAVESCNVQVFAALLDAQGTLASEPVILSNDPNPCKDVNLSWDGTGFTALWTLLRANYRYQVFYGRAVCD